MKLSIVLNTCRDMYPINGLNIDVFTYLLNSLRTQSFQDFELIIIDREFEERKNWIETLQIPVPFKYCPPKPNPFSGLNNLVNISSDRNSGILLSRGELIMCLTDCVMFGHKDLLKQIIHYYFDKGILLRPIVRGYGYKQDKDNPKITLDPLEEWIKTQEDKDIHEVSGNCTYSYLFPGYIYETVNGFDERCDLLYGSEDCIFNNIVDQCGFKRYIIPNQYHFIRAVHSHKYSTNGSDLLCCKEAYPQWMYEKISSGKLTSNSTLLTDEDVSDIKLRCESCKISCGRRGNTGLEYYRIIQPIFNLKLWRKKMLARFSNVYGTFDPWK